MAFAVRCFGLGQSKNAYSWLPVDYEFQHAEGEFVLIFRECPSNLGLTWVFQVCVGCDDPIKFYHIFTSFVLIVVLFSKGVEHALIGHILSVSHW